MNKKVILYSIFTIFAGIVVGAFLTADSYIQLIVAVILFPLLALFFFSLFPRKVQIAYSGGSVSAGWTRQAPTGERENKGGVDVIDIDKRAFLKLIGGAGIAYFIFSLFNRRVDGLFSKGLPSLQGNSSNVALDKEGLARSQPTDGYNISEVDDGVIAFFGFTNQDGAWFVMRQDNETGSFRYTKGVSDFPGNWAKRTKLKYDYYNNVFKLN